MGKLDGMVCLVTGAAQGMGRGMVIRMASEGARVAVNDVSDDDRLKGVVAEMGGFPAPADIADPVAVRRMVGDVEAALGPIEVLVCNAARMTMMPFLEEPPEQWWEQVDVNLTGHMDVIAAVLPGMRRLGRGRVVIISSLWGPTGWENASGYTATKSGLISLGRALGRELAPEGIYVTIIAPGITDTPQLQVDADDAGVTLEEIHAFYAKNIPAGRIAVPDDIARVVVFLSTESARAFVGQTIQPNGGEVRASM
jgi:NAD(P)-dependent dehydrogenase (short-subunit alcohol dehydrogenase family)